MGVIVVNKIYKTVVNSKSRLCYDFKINNEEKTLWYEVDPNYDNYLVDDRADAFISAFIVYAMINNLDIVSKVPMSKSIYYNINNHFIKALSYGDKRFHNIKITSEYIDDLEKNNDHQVGTGMSGGIDSFTTFFINSSGSIPLEYRINNLTFFETGAALSSVYRKYPIDDVLEFKKDYIVDDVNKLAKKRLEISKENSEKLGLPLIHIKTNLKEVQPSKHLPVLTLRAISAVLATQKYFTIYYFASGYPVDKFGIDVEDSTKYDLLTLSMFTTQATKFIPGDIGYNRVEKTKFISDKDFIKENLNVCWWHDKNCGKCGKCLRTLLTLDFLNKLEDFSNVFDVKSYNKNRKKYIARMFVDYKLNPYYNEIVDYYRENKNNVKKFKTFKYYLNLTYFRIRRIVGLFLRKMKLR